MAYDHELARRILNKAGKEITAAMSEQDNARRHDNLVKALNDVLFMHDVLHLYEKELDVIDPFRI